MPAANRAPGVAPWTSVCCVATAETVMVLIDETTRRSTPLTEILRAYLEAVLVRQAASGA